jgi:TldD protein
MRRTSAPVVAGLLYLLAGCAAGQQASSPDPLLAVLTKELQRSFESLKKTPTPPYFISYQLTDNRAFTVVSSFGALTDSNEHRTRLLDVDLRVGDPSLDNTHPLREAAFSMSELTDQLQARKIPLEDDPDALRMALWYVTDQQYKRAVERFQQVKTNVAVKVEAEDKSGDFSQAPAETYSEPIAAFSFDSKSWEQRVRQYTVPFKNHAEILDASAEVIAENETRRYANSEGSAIRISSPLYRIIISASIKADDGMQLPLHQTYMSFHEDDLPSDATVLKDVNRMVDNLLALRKAPLADAYTGPAILSGRASSVFFHEIFGHRIEGQRQKNEDEAQTFKKKVNQAVLPDFLSVYSDPTLRRTANTDLVGYYLYDDEGVKARRVSVVEDGILKNFLTSRSPIEGFPQSNGHGRRQQGYHSTARQANLVVVSKKSVTRSELKKMLIEQVKNANKPYGLLFDDIEGGFTFTQRILPNAFNVRPTMVYRVYLDGHEELVRGVDLIGTPLIAFSKIVAADDDIEVFNGMCGAESGWVPVSASSPGLLVTQIETQRKEKSQERLPVLPPPPASGN